MTRRMIFLHGLESSSRAYKASVIRRSYPELIVPDFTGSLEKRMQKLYPIIGNERGWTIIGSSFGGLMGALFTCEHPDQVEKLVMLAPALMLPQFALHLESSTPIDSRLQPVSVPTIIIHGTQDTVVPLKKIRELAPMVFTNLKFEIVNDDHRLHTATDSLDWRALLA